MVLELKRYVYHILVFVLIITGLFGPWLSKFDELYMVENEKTSDLETRYHIKTILSPFYVSLIRDTKIVNIMYFVSPGTSFSGLIILLSSIVSIIKLNDKWINFFSFMFSVLGIIIFFLSMGAGLSIGFKTNLEWGLTTTIIGIILNYLIQIMQNLRPKDINE